MNHLIKSGRLGIALFRAFTCILMCFDKDGTLADSSAMNTKHSVWITAQVPPQEAVIMSKAIPFGRTDFLIRDILVFSKDRFSVLSTRCSLRAMSLKTDPTTGT